MPVPLLLLIFLVLLGALSGAALLLLRPTRDEERMERHLAGIHQVAAQERPGAASIRKQEPLSPLPWLHALLAPLPGTQAAQRLLQQSGTSMSLAKTLLLSLALGTTAALALAWLALPAPLIIVPAAAVAAAPGLTLLALRNRRFRRFNALLPETIDLMTRALKAGHTITAALRMIAEEVPAPVGPEFRVLYEEQALGLPVRDALLNLVERVPIDDVSVLVTCILVQRETGGNLTEILSKIAQMLRDRLRLRGQLRVYTAQGRMTGWVLCGLPFFIFFVLMAINRGYESQLLTNPSGRHALYTGLVLMVFGILTMRKIIRIKV